MWSFRFPIISIQLYPAESSGRNHLCHFPYLSCQRIGVTAAVFPTLM